MGTHALWIQIDTLVQTSNLVIDRPGGSRHPRISSVVYPLDYGYLSNTSGGDGNEVDVWRGSLPETCLDAVICTTVLRKRDTEVKLLIGCSTEEKQIVRKFHKTNGMGMILIERKAT
jgi:inorganic pyrophosphatase